MLNQYETDDKAGGVGDPEAGDENDKAGRAVLKSLKVTKPHKNVVKTRQKILKGANYTSKIVSSFKAVPMMTSALVKVQYFCFRHL